MKFRCFCIPGSNALLVYSLPFESQFFDIEERTGVIYVKNDLTPLSSKVITLGVVVRDSGSPSYKAHTKVKVNTLCLMKLYVCCVCMCACGVCACVCVCTCVCTCAHVCARVHVCVHMCAHMCVCTCARVYVCTCAHVCVCARVYVHVCVRVSVHACMHAYLCLSEGLTLPQNSTK